MNRLFASLCLSCGTFLGVPLAASAQVSMAWSPVGDPGNANAPNTSIGSVPYDYNIGTYDVTNNQYVAFLNAKADVAVQYGLYNSGMSDPTYGGISYNGSQYSVAPGAGNHPVNYVTYYDAIRFANWMNNGQGTGSTETGAYSLLGGTPVPSNFSTFGRNATATIFLPSDSEWYKAAYYAGGGSYYQFPGSSNIETMPAFPTATPNSGNLEYIIGNLTDVGAYTGTTSPYGAFDMAGNVEQWVETEGNTIRALQGSTFEQTANSRLSDSGESPTDEVSAIGFRLASISPPVLPGDVNFDHIVNGQDIAVLASNWLHTGFHGPGDANGDGIVNGQDIAIIASNWLHASGGGVGSGAAVPEPSTLILAAVGGLAMLPRRRRPA